MEDFILYIKGVFEAIGIQKDFSVIDIKTDNIPIWAKGIEPTGSFLVSTANGTYSEKLERFLHKKIYAKDDILFWFDGEPVDSTDTLPLDHTSNQDANITNDESQIKRTGSSKKMKSSTRLPSWIDSYIFGVLGAKWEADYQKFGLNIGSSEEDNLIYLGTYFPRSYADSFCVFEYLFSNEEYQNLISQKKTLKLLSVGCGTGGDIIGVITVLLKHSHYLDNIDVDVIDGNEYALGILERILDKFKEKSKKHISLKTSLQVIDTFDSVDLSALRYSSYDFILTSKMIGEVISAGHGLKDDSYYKFGQAFLPLLSENGVCMILDVTTKPSNNSFFNPELLNKQLNQLLRDMPEFQSILPSSCAKNGADCFNPRCFQQNEFSVSHSHRSNDKCRVVYRLVGTKSLCDAINFTFEETEHNDNCCYTIGTDKGIDSHQDLINNNTIEKTGKESTSSLLSEPSKDDDVISTPKIGITIVGKIDLTKFEKPRKEIKKGKENIYIIDTNVFVNEPTIISRIDKKYRVVLSAKVVDELDKLKITLNQTGKTNVQKALKYINNNIGNGQLTMATANLELLPAEFSRKSPDNMIIAVALAFAGSNPIILTSDNGMQVKAKGLGITTISLSEFVKQNKIK